MVKLSVDIDDSNFFKIIEAVKESVPLALKYTATDVWANIRKEAPVDHGRLAGSFGLKRESDLVWHIKSGVEYALAVYSGTGVRGDTSKGASGKIIDIFPSTKKALYWPGAAHPVKHVRHPGIRSNPYIDRAFDATTKRTNEFVKRAMRELGLS